MAKFRSIYVVVAAIMMCVFVAGCTDEFKEAVRDLFGYSKSLTHGIDNRDERAVDYMRANIKITENENETNLPSAPAMEARISLAKSQISIEEAQVVDQSNLSADSVKYDGKNWSGSQISTTDNSVIQWYLPGGQVVTVPVNITALRAQYKGKMYEYGTDSLVGHTLSVKYMPAGTTRSANRASGADDQYNAVYEATLTFKEVNHRDSMFTVKLRASALANVATEQSDSLFTENGHWVWVSDSTYTWDFDIVRVTNDDTIRVHKSIPAKYHIKGIAPYEKIVKSFSYQFGMSNGWAYGSGEQEIESAIEFVTFYQKSEDHYGATIVNLDDNDKIVTDYTAILQRVVYDDGEVRSVSDYPEVTAKEASTFVKMLAQSAKEDYDAALLTNSVDFEILEHVQNISEEVTLYVQKNIVVSKEIIDAVLKVYDDYVEASLTYRETYLNGDVKDFHDKRSFARSRKTLSDWMVTEQYYTAMTDTAKTEVVSTSAREDGYWNWTVETREITTIAHLYSSSQTNRWREMVANSIKYTREGITHEFGKIEYVAKEAGHTVNMVNADEYAYSDSISITFGDNVLGMTAPGLIRLTGKEIKGYENRNKEIEVTSDSVLAKVDHVTKYTDGTEDVDKVSHAFPRTRTAGAAWSSYENNGNEYTGNVVTVSLEATEKVVEGEWSCIMQTRNLSTSAVLSTSTQRNNWTSKDPNRIQFTRNGLTADFGELQFKAIKNNSSSTLKESDLTQDTYAYVVGITENYGEHVDIMGGEGTIIVKKGKTIIGHQVRNAKITVSDNKVEASLTFVDLWSDGTETSVDDIISVDRSLEGVTNWSASSDYANVLTGAAVVNLSSASTVNDGYWTYVNQTRNITTPVTLSNSTETNGWISVDPNSFVYEREGVVYKFDEINYTAEESGSALGQLASETETESIYDYTGGIKVTFGGNIKTSTVPGKVSVKKVIDYSVKNAKLTVNDDNVLAELDFVTTIDGKETSEHYAKSFPKSLVCTTNWSSNESAVFMSVYTSAANTTLSSSESISDGDWKYVRENRTITTKVTLANSEQTNSWTSIVPNKIVFSKNGVSHDFGEISFTATEAGQNYTVSGSSANVSTYDYTDKLDVAYGDNTVSSVAPGKIIVEYSVDGNEIRDQKLEVSETGVTTTLTWVTKYGNGYEKTETISHFFALSIEKLTNWASTEVNSNSTTSAASVNLESSTNEKDGDWSNVREVRTVNTVATLAGSTQNNTLRASMPNSITFSRDGKTYTFDVLNFAASEAGQNVSKTSESDVATVYGYTDNVDIVFGGRTFGNTLNGTITVEKAWESDIPAEYGKFKSAVCTATPNENRSSWVYVLSVHFENGTMPIKIGRGATNINLEEAKSLFTTNTKDEINSLVYTGGKWINAIAQDTDRSMKWKDENGTTKRSLDYISATAQGWNDGHNTVNSSAVTYSVSDNILYVNKGGSNIGKIKLNK